MRLRAGAIGEVKVLSQEMPVPDSRRKLRRREAGWEATGGEHAVRRIATNTIRPYVATSLRIQGEVQTRREDRGACHAGRAAEKRWQGASGVW